MRSRLLSFVGAASVAGCALAAGPFFAGCATSAAPLSGFDNGGSAGAGSDNSSGGGGSAGASGLGGFANSGQGLGNVTMSSGTDGSMRTRRYDDAGNAYCFNIASVGYGGGTGAQFGNTMVGGTDNTQAFVNYLNANSSANVAMVGCGQDVGCSSPAKPTLDMNFLSQYDVLIFQWMSNGLVEVDENGMPISQTNGKPVGFRGDSMGYWTFSQDELDAFKAWVQGGGGAIFLSGYDWSDGEIGPANQLLQAVTDIQYTSTDTFGMTETGNAYYCLGDSNIVSGWAGSNDALASNIMSVGAFHGRGINAGSNATIDCKDATNGVCAAHEDVGMGHVYAYSDEWVTYTSQWNPSPQPATYCNVDGSTANGGEPAVQFQYQVVQFWYNAIYYASLATMCPFMLMGAVPR